LASCDANSVRIADRRLPARWMKTLRVHSKPPLGQ
jgi:hypothetical protein